MKFSNLSFTGFNSYQTYMNREDVDMWKGMHLLKWSKLYCGDPHQFNYSMFILH